MNSTNDSVATLLAEVIQRAEEVLPNMMEDAVVRALEKSKIQLSQVEPVTRGTAVSHADKTGASDLRDAYLLGKLPEDGSLLIGKSPSFFAAQRLTSHFVTAGSRESDA